MTTAVKLALYRDLLRSCRRVRSSMRASHVVLISECVNRFANGTTPQLQQSVKSHGPLPLSGLVTHAFRHADDVQYCNENVDLAFCALRGVGYLEEFILTNNELYDSLESLSDREAPAEPSLGQVATSIIQDAKPSSSRRAPAEL